jgi:hypothetical protein
MAPEWARATRPLVVIFTGIGILVTLAFSADVDAQAGAYATGVLVLMSSGAVAVAITAWRQDKRWVLFISITVVFVYTSVTNMIERPEGIKIASIFILTIVVTSLVSRTWRSTELRVLGVEPDLVAQRFIDDAARGREINIIANRPGAGDRKEYEEKLREARQAHHLTPDDPHCFLRSRGAMPRNSATCFRCGALTWRILRCAARSPQSQTRSPRFFFTSATRPERSSRTSDGPKQPIAYMLKFLALGEGDTAPVTREVLRQAEGDPLRRPWVHVG